LTSDERRSPTHFNSGKFLPLPKFSKISLNTLEKDGVRGKGVEKNLTSTRNNSLTNVVAGH